MADFPVNCVNMTFLHFLVHCLLSALLPYKWAQDYQDNQWFQWSPVRGCATFLPGYCMLSVFLAIASLVLCLGANFHLLADDVY